MNEYAFFRRAPRVAGRRPRMPARRVKLVELNRWATRYGNCMPSLSPGEELCGGAAWARGAAAAVAERPGDGREGARMVPVRPKFPSRAAVPRRTGIWRCMKLPVILPDTDFSCPSESRIPSRLCPGGLWLDTGRPLRDAPIGCRAFSMLRRALKCTGAPRGPYATACHLSCLPSPRAPTRRGSKLNPY